MFGCVLENVNIPDDLPIIYAFMNNDEQYLFSTKLKCLSERNFEKWFLNRLSSDFHDFYTIKSSATQAVLGYVHNYDFSLIDGTCKLAVYVIPNCRHTGIGGLAAVQFMKKLFYEYPLRKLYSTIYEYNQESLKSNLAAGFKKEGILKDYRYHNGKWHDMYFLSINRETFERTLGKLVI